MNNFLNSTALKLSLICGVLTVSSVTLLSLVFYFSTVGVLARGVDEKITAIADRFTHYAGDYSSRQLVEKINFSLNDGIDADTEIFLLVSAEGKILAGNIDALIDTPPPKKIIDHEVIRAGAPSLARILLHRLPDGALLIVGRDMKDLNQINKIIWRAIGIGAFLTLILAVIGTFFFRSRIESKIFAIRQAALDIEVGNLSRRIPVYGKVDEFALLSHDLNRMLDRIEQLMEGVRHVSNTVAHNLRTPLGRIRGHLEEALRGETRETKLVIAGRTAIQELDDLVTLLNKLLQVSEAESGMRRQNFRPIILSEVVANIVELYDAATEEMGVTLTTTFAAKAKILGDQQLLASALANLLDNALKYTTRPANIHVSVTQQGHEATITLCDDGPGIPKRERANVLQRFYRLDHNRQGSGIGLSIVAAIVNLHDGALYLEDASPGLQVRMVFPHIGVVA